MKTFRYFQVVFSFSFPPELNKSKRVLVKGLLHQFVLCFFFKKMANAGLFFVYFLVFSNKHQYNFYNKSLWKMSIPSSIRRRDSKIKLDQITRNYSQAAEDEAQTETQTNKKWKDGIWFDGLTWFCDWLFTLFLGFKSKPESKSTF